jgi:hypothetical protein
MITLDCSKKLQTFLGLENSKKPVEAEYQMYHWYASLFYLGGKKCLIFMNHSTYFSFAIFNVKKSDMLHLDEIFINGFIKELYRCDLIGEKQESILRSKKLSLNLQSSTNNKSVIGCTNNFIDAIKYFFISSGISGYEFHNMKYFINETPVSPLGYRSPVEAMKNKFESFLNVMFTINLN